VLSAASVLLIVCIAVRNHGLKEIWSVGSMAFIAFYIFVGACVLFAFVIDRGLSQFIDAIVNGVIGKLWPK
jgi:hypothetical protein